MDCLRGCWLREPLRQMEVKKSRVNARLCGRALFPKVVFPSPGGRERRDRVAAGAVVCRHCVARAKPERVSVALGLRKCLKSFI